MEKNGIGPIFQDCQWILLPKLEPIRCPTYSTNSEHWLKILSLWEDSRLLRATFTKRFFLKRRWHHRQNCYEVWRIMQNGRWPLSVEMSKADIYSLERFSRTHFHGPRWQGEWGGKLPVTILFQANGIFQEKKEQRSKKRRLHKPKLNWNPSISLSVLEEASD